MDYDGNTVGKSLSFANNLPGTLAMFELDKTDIKGSFVIADRLRFGRVPQAQVPDEFFSVAKAYQVPLPSSRNPSYF
jgi:hypothetical protein